MIQYITDFLYKLGLIQVPKLPPFINVEKEVFDEKQIMLDKAEVAFDALMDLETTINLYTTPDKKYNAAMAQINLAMRNINSVTTYLNQRDFIELKKEEFSSLLERSTKIGYNPDFAKAMNMNIVDDLYNERFEEDEEIKADYYELVKNGKLYVQP
jgi:hypothetical protein